MADTNVTANTGTGGAKFSVDDDGTQVWPYSKLAWGPGGTRNEVDDASGKRLPVKDDIATLAGTAVDVNSGTKSAGTLRVVIATDQPALTNKLLVTPDSVALPANQSVNVAQINGVTPLMGSGNTGTGSPRVTVATDQPNLTTPLNVQDLPVTSGGLSFTHVVSAGSTNATNVKASAGQVYSITAFNLNAAARYLKFHNNSGTPTAGSGVVYTVMIPGNTAGAGAVINIDKGLAFSTGIAFTLVTGIADADSTGVAASEIVVNIGYK